MDWNGLYGGMLARLGKDCLCWPRGQTDLYLLNVGSLGRVGVEGLGHNLLPREERPSPKPVLAPTAKEVH